MSRPAISSSDSSPASFHTAAESELSRQSTAATSPLHTRHAPFRDVRPLPRELKAHCQIFLEEQLYLGAINLYNSLLGAGSSRRPPTSRGVYVPPASHLAVLNTLLVHPAYTSRADKQSQEVATLALSYLRSLVEVVGPINANLRVAFQFYSTPRWHRRTGYGSDGALSDGSQDERERDRVTGSLANENSIWSRGQDFWSTLGWAFNCSTLYPQRWRYWKAWLEFMLDVLQSDWSERERLDLDAHEASGGDGPVPTTMRQESILAMYMEQKNGPQGGFKAIMKALFADGGSLSTSSFHEVFDKEPRGRHNGTKKRKRDDRVDIDNDKFGDYLDDDPFSSSASEPPTPEKPRDARASAAPFGATFPGLAETVPLRLRLFQLLSGATSALRRPSDVARLYDAYASSLKVVPLDLFALVVAQRRGPLPPELRVTLLKVLFGFLLPSSHRPPHRVDPEGEAEARLSTAMLERCYAPHPANTVGVEDNAKLSLLVEAALQLLWACNALAYSPALDAAVRAGIDARHAKIRRKRTGRARAEPDDVLAAEMLDASADRLRILLRVIQSSSTDGA
ncbi:major facilitator superfamily transporter [Cordyceps javanica]|uniref:Major facilitator superfamily transporter n=1 Tax=Cordyceps javanica TaxID=43265 RepID=A0A545VV37_9HYPO|nr:major facilitator superfamily transporter [Cordyceps javanica]TQW05589.1 major facilitator superfamily transporter [Cordyceps javanica]